MKQIRRAIPDGFSRPALCAGLIVISALAVLLSFLLFPQKVLANHFFYPEGTDYWHVELLSGPKQFPKQEQCWVRGADGREYYYENGVLQRNVLTIDNMYVGEDGARLERTSIDDYDMVTASRGCTVAVVSKSGHRMELWRDKVRVYSFVVSTGSRSAEGDKSVQGDRRTPVGEFYVSRKIPDSFAYLALNLSYPNIEDAERGLRAGLISDGTFRSITEAIRNHGYPSGDTVLGGAIQIHGCRAFTGADASRGCVEMLSRDMEVVFNCMEKGDKVIILP